MNEIMAKLDPDDELDIRDRLAFQITTLGNVISQWASRAYLSKCGVTMTEWRVLVMLETIGPMTARKICELTKMDKGNVSRAVKKLIADKRVSETPDPEDRRAVILNLTAKGHKKYLEVRRYSDERENRLSAAVGQDNREMFEKIIGRLKAESERMLNELET